MNDERPMRAKVLEMLESENHQLEGDVAIAAIVEAVDAQTAALESLNETIRVGLDAIQHWMRK